jgi:peptidoglycan/xylan/chitin deacetylase (PgdA/CDA1 family)
MSLIVKIGKKGKRIVKKFITPAEKHNLSYTRRIEQIKTDRRICAMTFDDGPMDMPAAPDRFDGKSLTDILLDTLAEFGAKGTFDVVGDTSANYPDQAGKVGSAAWGGVKYDHYPDIHCDDKGGAEHNDRLIRRILAEGHQITNHGYRHIIFGKKPFVYGARVYLGSVDKAVEDLRKLDALMRDRYGYQISMHRPPHYVDRMQDGFTSYDVCDRMGYQYMAASFDGAGWLPSTLSDPEAALEAEVNAMVEPMRKALEKDPDFFCGQIIFQKDGYNMGKRTPVAFGLRKQLELLKEYGYQVVTVETLMAESPFADLGRDDPLFEKLYKLQQERAIVFSDNRLRLDDPMTYGELAMLLAPKNEALDRRWAAIRKSGKHADAYCGAMDWCVEKGLIPVGTKSSDHVTALPDGLFAPVSDHTRRSVYAAFKNN